MQQATSVLCAISGTEVAEVEAYYEDDALVEVVITSNCGELLSVAVPRTFNDTDPEFDGTEWVLVQSDPRREGQRRGTEGPMATLRGAAVGFVSLRVGLSGTIEGVLLDVNQLSRPGSHASRRLEISIGGYCLDTTLWAVRA